MKLKKFLCLFLGLLVVSALIVPVSAGSLDAYFSSGGEKDYRFVSGNENQYKRAWAKMGDCKRVYQLRAYLGNELEDTGRVWCPNPPPIESLLYTNWHFTGTGILQELAFRVIWVLPYCVLMLFMVFKVGVI